VTIDSAKLGDLRERLRLLDDTSQSGADAETHYFDLVGELLQHEGYTVTAMRAQPDRGLDLTAKRSDAGRETSVGVEFKHFDKRRLIPARVLEGALAAATREGHDRLFLVGNRPYTRDLVELAAREAPVKVKLLGLPDLRDWVDRIAQTLSDATHGVVQLTREYLVRVVRAIAAKPPEARFVEWRTLEQLLGEVFSGLGFTAQVTPATADGGKDVVLTANVTGQKRTYFIELKHWLTSRPGPKLIEQFIKVTAAERTSGGLFMASSGFTAPSFEVLGSIERPTALGDHGTLTALCRSYVRAESGLWSPPSDPFEVLAADAKRLRHGPA